MFINDNASLGEVIKVANQNQYQTTQDIQKASYVVNRFDVLENQVNNHIMPIIQRLDKYTRALVGEYSSADFAQILQFLEDYSNGAPPNDHKRRILDQLIARITVNLII